MDLTVPALIRGIGIRAFKYFKWMLWRETMDNHCEKYFYSAFGLNIISEFKLPELNKQERRFQFTEIEIKREELTNYWGKLGEESKKKFVVVNNEVMFEVPETAIFLVRDGKEIIVSPMGRAEEDKIRLYILGTCMGAILIQNKILSLHGSAVAINGKAYAIIGESGAGKSTLAKGFINKGYQLLSDDLIPIFLSKDNLPYVSPSYPQQKLWEDSLNQFGLGTVHFQPLFDRETKYAVPVSSHFFDNPLPLAGIIELEKSNTKNIEISKVEGLQRFRILFQHTYRNLLISRLGLVDWHFYESARIVGKIHMYNLKRPNESFTVFDQVTQILNCIHEEVIRC